MDGDGEGGEAPVTTLIDVPDGPPRAVFTFAHGAGASMTHPFMEGCARRLSAGGIAVVRYAFPYMDAGRKAPDRPTVLMNTVASVVAIARARFPGVPLLAGGKSMGGRMTSLAQAERGLDGVRGLAFFGFPLHAAGQAATVRGEHLSEVRLPMIFLQGSRDRLADLDLLVPILRGVTPEPVLHVLDGADHGFHVLKRSGRTDADVLDEVCSHFSRWVERFD